MQHGDDRFLQATGFMTLLPQSEHMRRNMVDSQLRTSGVNTPWILAAMLATPREAFVPGDANIAYMDRAIPLGDGRMMNPPIATAQMLQLANVQAEDHVLLLCDASGYVAELIANRVASLDSIKEYDANGPFSGPYSLILIDGAIETLPDSLTAQLADGGRIVTGVIDGPVTRLAVGVKHGNHLALRAALDMEIAILPSFARAKEFVF
jgi:protein-L-isoaspartate(D-aspartate) O-methyltransferase